MMFSLSVLEDDIQDNLKTVSRAESALRAAHQGLNIQEMLQGEVLGSLSNLVKAPVISLREFKEMRDQLRSSRERGNTHEERRQEAALVLNKALAVIPVLRRQYADLEQQLDNYRPTTNVLEFRRDK